MSDLSPLGAPKRTSAGKSKFVCVAAANFANFRPQIGQKSRVGALTLARSKFHGSRGTRPKWVASGSCRLFRAPLPVKQGAPSGMAAAEPWPHYMARAFRPHARPRSSRSPPVRATISRMPLICGRSARRPVGALRNHCWLVAAPHGLPTSRAAEGGAHSSDGSRRLAKPRLIASSKTCLKPLRDRSAIASVAAAILFSPEK
jgi:hypothetical protein